ncbi:hypothetical protein WJ542_29790 [Paraburkholderia sp. B3]|uniref:hypothetical protein n=1 Tax=Paraburkholderia sp. B3 TaxID=3134791 RepID=UPI003982BA96
MKITLTTRQKNILGVLRTKDSGKNSDIFENLENGYIDPKDIEWVCGIINDEFMMKGIQLNFEPNDYGRELENLLDVINRPRLG